jgi:hypothetical protein
VGDNRTLGRPKHVFRCDEAMRWREQGISWRRIAAELDVPVNTVVVGVLVSESF